MCPRKRPARSAISFPSRICRRCANWRCAVPRRRSTGRCWTCRDHRRSWQLGGERAYLGGRRRRAASQWLVRAAKRLADALRAPWYGGDRRDTAGGGSQARQVRLSDALSLAARLGAVLVTVPPPACRAGFPIMRANARDRDRAWHSPAIPGGAAPCAGRWRTGLRRATPGVALHVAAARGTDRSATAGVRGSFPVAAH